MHTKHQPNHALETISGNNSETTGKKGTIRHFALNIYTWRKSIPTPLQIQSFKGSNTRNELSYSTKDNFLNENDYCNLNIPIAHKKGKRQFTDTQFPSCNL